MIVHSMRTGDDHDGEVQEPSGDSTRHIGMRPRLLAAVVLLGLATAPFPQPPAHAECAGPTLKVQGMEEEPALLHRGEQVTVMGRGFVNGCDDTGGGSGFGCSGNDDGEIESPMVNIELVLLQGQPTMKQTSLALSDAGTAADGQLGWGTWTFTVPTHQPLGRAVLKTEGSSPLPIRVPR